MVKHIVLFKWNENATAQALTKIDAEICAMKGKIPGIIDLSYGENFLDTPDKFTHALVVDFTDKAALEAYAPHPIHKAIVDNLINPIKNEVLRIDYEF